jgi:hypothetical protein
MSAMNVVFPDPVDGGVTPKDAAVTEPESDIDTHPNTDSCSDAAKDSSARTVNANHSASSLLTSPAKAEFMVVVAPGDGDRVKDTPHCVLTAPIIQAAMTPTVIVAAQIPITESSLGIASARLQVNNQAFGGSLNMAIAPPASTGMTGIVGHYAAVDTPPLKTGDLWKLGHKLKTWKKRYFVLESGVLKYYACRDSTSLQNRPINLRDLVTSINVGKNGLSNYTFVHLENAKSASASTVSGPLGDGSALPEASDDYVLCEKMNLLGHPDDANLPSGQAIAASSSYTILMNDTTEFRPIVSLLLRFDTAALAISWAEAINRHIYFKNNMPLPPIHTGYMKKEGDTRKLDLCKFVY